MTIFSVTIYYVGTLNWFYMPGNKPSNSNGYYPSAWYSMKCGLLEVLPKFAFRSGPGTVPIRVYFL